MFSTRHYQVRSKLDLEPFSRAVAGCVRGPFMSTGEARIRDVESRTPNYSDVDCIVDVCVGFTVEGHVRRVQEIDEVKLSGGSDGKVYELALPPYVLKELFARQVVDKAVEYIEPESLRDVPDPEAVSVRRSASIY